MSQQPPTWWHGDVSQNNLIIPTDNPDQFTFETPGVNASKFTIYKDTGNSTNVYVTITTNSREAGDSWSRMEFLHTMVLTHSRPLEITAFNTGLARAVNADLVIENKCAVKDNFFSSPGPIRRKAWRHEKAAHVFLEDNLRHQLATWLGVII